MDVLSHILVGINLSNFVETLEQKALVVLFSVSPDLGEIIIQKQLNRKFGGTFGVYDSRTSDSEISNNIRITWLYDLFHSPLFYCSLIAIIFLFNFETLKIFIIAGLFHILLDFSTHGKVWALKLFFPISNVRYPILEKTIGNWWDWTPKIKFFKIKFPFYCILTWLFLIFSYFITLKF